MNKINLVDSNLLDFDQPAYPPSRAAIAMADADRIGDARASVLVRIVARSFDVTPCEMFHHSRSRAPIAATRQLAMYMMHVVLGRNLTEVGKFFGRDRTTVSHACIRIEDMRDDLEFDERINQLEHAFEQATFKTGSKNSQIDESIFQ
ncbi:hypothetical protein MNBD_ALPHA11-2492 [hydrothermal vent metagenome]|uniref:Chromosomal replication initiator DnaA C-terminal domain-containing protein n=1 Tax=hydrothermal vent metagenome TaxID=652676 RepID=A0A3B0TWM4_9ZZZZ